jgi:hypothetical protein
LSEIIARIRAGTARTIRTAPKPQASFGPAGNIVATANHLGKVQGKQKSALQLHNHVTITAHRFTISVAKHLKHSLKKKNAPQGAKRFDRIYALR